MLFLSLLYVNVMMLIDGRKIKKRGHLLKSFDEICDNVDLVNSRGYLLKKNTNAMRRAIKMRWRMVMHKR